MSTLLEQVLRANLYLQPIQLVLSITSNLINIRVLSSRSLRSSPCTHYFLAYAVFSIIYTCLVCPTQFLRGFHMDWAQTRLGCKLHFFFLFVVPVQAKAMLLLAAFDRYCSSLRSRQLNSSDTLRTARIAIIVTTIVVSIYMSPMLLIYTWSESNAKCFPRSSTWIRLYVSSQISIYYMLTPMLMIAFGILTISNIREQSRRARICQFSMRHRRTEGQLARMLLIQVAVHVILGVPFGITYSMNALFASTRTPTILAIRYILVLWQQCDYFVSFFLYVLSASAYRLELNRIWMNMRRIDANTTNDRTIDQSLLQFKQSTYPKSTIEDRMFKRSDVR